LPSKANPKIGIVGALRGFAALFVCWYHFVYGQQTFLKWSAEYGWLGVHIFFVISGFIIPYSLYQYRYSIRDYFRFVGKRLARLHPPYLVSIALVIALDYAMMLIPHWKAPTPDTSLLNLASHFFYLNDFIARPWLNVVYWTLSIELQWYLLLGLVFPLLGSRRWNMQLSGALLLILGHRLVPSEHVIFHIVPVFLIGVFVFQYRMGISSLWRALVSIAAMFMIMRVPIGMPVASTSVVAGLLIAFVTFENRWMLRLGEVSYSLYLLHIPIGLRVIDLFSRLPWSGELILLIDIMAIAICLYASVLFYRWIEAPSQKWSSAIKIKPVPKPAEELVAATAGAD
jgi:peptidoglycan/LPS O-acetylase OafA/YrhL